MLHQPELLTRSHRDHRLLGIVDRLIVRENFEHAVIVNSVICQRSRRNGGDRRRSDVLARSVSRHAAQKGRAKVHVQFQNMSPGVLLFYLI